MNIATYRTIFIDNKPASILEKINVNLEYYKALRERLKIKKIVGKNFVRLGRPNDGGYIMVNNFSVSGGGIAYSFGIADDVSWDSDMVRRGYDVFMYDPTIDALPQNHERFHFFKEGILGIEVKEQSMNTLENFIKRNGHESKSDMILKMDVEGAEWSFLSTVTSETLNQFDQIIFELHDLTKPKDQSVMNATLACLSKINRTHSLVHLHAYSGSLMLTLDDKISLTDNLEVTYVKTSNYELVDDENIFLPISLDQPGNGYQEISLGYWNKKFNNVVKTL